MSYRVQVINKVDLAEAVGADLEVMRQFQCPFPSNLLLSLIFEI
jgi:hypothetical protein